MIKIIKTLKKSNKFKTFRSYNKYLSNKELCHYIEVYKDNILNYDLMNYEIFCSTNMNGNSINIDRAKKILDTNIKNSNSHDIQQLINYKKAILKYPTIDSLTIDLILDIHNTFKENDNNDYINIDPQLINTINKFNKSAKKLEDIFLFIFKFIEFEPFHNKNQNVSLLITNALLRSINMAPMIISPQDKNYFYDALKHSINKNNENFFVRYSLEYLLFSCVNGLEFIKKIK